MYHVASEELEYIVIWMSFEPFVLLYFCFVFELKKHLSSFTYTESQKKQLGYSAKYFLQLFSLCERNKALQVWNDLCE